MSGGKGLIEEPDFAEDFGCDPKVLKAKFPLLFMRFC